MRRLRGPTADLGDRRPAAARRRLNRRPRHAGAQHASDPGVAVFVLRPAAVLAFSLRLDDALRLAPTALLVVLASYRGEHVEHHAVEGGEHAGRELVAWRGKLPACRKVERDDADLAGVQFGAQLAPV